MRFALVVAVGMILLIGGARANAGVYSRSSFYPYEPFTDDVLAQILQQSQAGVIYTWSPRMPLAELGLNEVMTLARARGIDLYVAQDPFVTPTIFPLIDSLKLIQMGILNHYPSYLFFCNGQIVSPMISGYERPQGVLVFLQQYLGGHLCDSRSTFRFIGL